MKHISFFLFVVLTIMTANKTFAQSPYKTNWQKNSLVLGGSVAIAFLASSLHTDTTSLTVDQINALSRDDVNWFDRSATYNYSESLASTSDVIVAACLLSPLTLFFSEEIRSDFSIVGIMYVETLLLATFTPSFGKSLGRIRPYAYNEDTPLDVKMNSDTKSSFWSGHTSWAFSSAVFFSTVYSDYFPNSKWKPYVWGGSLLAASTVGYLRVESGAHFPTDVLLGAAVGSAIGYFIPYIYRNRDGSNISVAPQVGFNQFELSARYSF